MAKDYTVKLAHAEEVATSVKHFTLEFEKKFDFMPGQFVMLEIKKGDEKGETVRRAYSIASLPGSRQIELRINIIPGGKMTSFLDGMRAGDKIKLSGPYGEFGTSLSNIDKDVMFIAAGTGIAPMRCMIRSLMKQGFKKKINLLYGFRHEGDFLFREELGRLAKKNRNLSLITAISRPGEPKKWKGFIGRVTDYLRANEISRNQEFYICGLAEMAEETKKILLSKGIKEGHIHKDAW